MFCQQCGNPLPENAKFCTACGASMNAPSDPTPAPAVETPAPVKVKKQRKRLSDGALLGIVLGAIAAVSAIAVLVVFLLIGGTKPGARSPELAAEEAVIAFATRDGEALLNLMPQALVERLADIADVDVENRDKLAKKVFETLGDDASFMDEDNAVTIRRIREGEEITKDRLEMYLEMIVRNGISRKETEKVTDAREFEISFSVNGTSVQTALVYVFEYEDRWYLYDWSIVTTEDDNG